MKIISETSLRGFEFWSGAEANANMLTLEELDQLEVILEDTYPDGITDIELNDLMWFDFETVCDWLELDYDSEKDIINRD